MAKLECQSVWIQSRCFVCDLIWAEWVSWDPPELVGQGFSLPPERVSLWYLSGAASRALGGQEKYLKEPCCPLGFGLIPYDLGNEPSWALVTPRGAST